MEQKKFRILVADNMAQEGIEILKAHRNFEVDVKTKHTPEELKAMVEPYDAVIIRSATKMTTEIIEAAKNLKVIARAGTGYDNIDIDACNKRGIVALITPVGNSNAVAELTVGLMLDYARNIAKANALMGQGVWEKKKLEGTELRGKTVGIVGVGRIGAAVAKRCKAFEMNIIGYDKFIPKARAEQLGVTIIDNFDEFLAQADYITLHIPLTENTRNLFDKEQFAKMKPNSVLINVARGEVINEKALYEALCEKKIGGACIDVYSKEPANKEQFPFIGLDNVIATPHLGASTQEAQIDVAKMAAEHVVQALQSHIFIDAVNTPFQLPEHLADLYKPWMDLASNMGTFLAHTISERFNEITIEYKGDIFTAFEPIKALILYSIFKNRLADIITYINLDEIITHEGIKVIVKKEEKKVFQNLEARIKITLKGEKEFQSKIVGTVFSGNPKFIEINQHYMDISPTNFMLLLKSLDKPGVIGRVGTFLGTKNINIASWQTGRDAPGSMALSVITLDSAVPAEVMVELRKVADIVEAKFVQL